MNRVMRLLGCVISGVVMLAALGCVTTPPELSYVALKRPVGPIHAKGNSVVMEFDRSGFYFLSYGFRPAPDIGDYLEKTHAKTGDDCLRKADIRLKIPISFDILLFGFQVGTDLVTANN